MKTPDQLIDFIARNEGGEHGYSSFNPNDNGQGIAWGAWQFNQRKGSLPKLLKLMYEADRNAFESIFGMHTYLLAEEGARHLRSAGTDLKGLRKYFEKAGQHPPFQQVQRDLARKEYLEPAWALAKANKLRSERAAAMCLDTAVQRGVGWLRENLFDLSSGELTERQVLEGLAKNADKGLGEKNGRRHKLLHSPALSDEPWTGLDTTPPPEPRPVLQFGMRSPAVRELQSKLLALGYRQSVNHSFGPETRDNVKAFQGACGLAVDSVVGPLTWAALDAALAAAGEEGEGNG